MIDGVAIIQTLLFKVKPCLLSLSRVRTKCFQVQDFAHTANQQTGHLSTYIFFVLFLLLFYFNYYYFCLFIILTVGSGDGYM